MVLAGAAGILFARSKHGVRSGQGTFGEDFSQWPRQKTAVLDVARSE